jgi:hypothetical protein
MAAISWNLLSWAASCNVSAGNTPILSKGWQIDRRFVVRYELKVPAMASCSNCKRKFFTPTALARDAVAAEEYLGHKFDTHECEELKR